MYVIYYTRAVHISYVHVAGVPCSGVLNVINITISSTMCQLLIKETYTNHQILLKYTWYYPIEVSGLTNQYFKITKYVNIKYLRKIQTRVCN